MAPVVLMGKISLLGPVLFSIFIDDLDERIAPTISRFADDTKLGESVHLQEDRRALQRHLDRLGHWAESNNVSFNKTKCRLQCCRLGTGWLDSSQAEGDLRALIIS